MANYVSQVTLPDGTSYDVRELFPHVGNCTDAAATAAKTVTIGNFKLYTGAWVVVKFSNTNSADVATLTLNVDGTGAKPIKYKNANLGWASQLAANRYTHFIYDGTNYQIIGDVNTDTYDRTSQQTRIYAGTVGVFNYSLCALDNNQRMQSFTTTAGTGTSKAFNTSAKFMYPAVIMYNAANSTYTNGTAIANNVLYEQFPNIDLRYSCNKTTSAGFTQYKPVYLECTLNSDGTLSITTNGLTQTFVTGKYYLLLGCMYNTSVYQLALFAQHPLFYYDGTNLNCLVFSAAEKTKLAGIEEGANKYVHPTYTSKTSGLYKITVDGTGHVSGTDTVTASDLPAHTHLYAGSASAGGPATQIATTVTNGTTTLTRYGIVFVNDPAVSEGNVSRKNNDFRVNFLNGTTSSAGYTELVLGNNKTSTTADNKYGMLTLYSPGANLGFFKTDTLSENRTYTFPNNTGTVALTSDIPTISATTTGSGNAVTSISYSNGVITGNKGNSFLPLSGGTITNSEWQAFKIKRTGTQSAGVHFENNNGYLGAVGMNTVNGPLMRWKTDSTTSYNILDTSSTSFTQVLTSGTKIGTIKIDGTSTDIFIPSDTDIHVRQNVSTSTDSYPVLLGAYHTASPTTAFSPTQITDESYLTDKMWLQPSTGRLTTKGDIILYSPDSNPTPGIYFRRGSYTDSTLDWRIYNNAGLLTFERTVEGDAQSWQTKVQFKGDGIYYENTKLEGDTKVSQSASTTANYRPIVLGYTSTTTPSSLAGTVTNQVYVTTNMYAQPSTGTIYSTYFRGTIYKDGGTWIQDRDTAPVYANKENSGQIKYYPIGFAKSKDGGWSIGSLGSDNNFYVIYTTDANYSTSTNQKVEIKFPTTDGTLALTSDIPSYSAGTGLSLSGTTFNHSNSVTAETSFVFKKIKYDAQGHITAVTAVEAGDLPSHTHPYLPDTTLYAGSSTQGGPATYVALPRVTEDAKSFPGTNKVVFKEYSNTSTNTPSSAWYHIISMQGSDNKYGTQLALGMTTAGIYYRNYNSQTWSSWQPMGRFTATPTSGQVVITDGTTGGIKSSGYTIAASVPSGAVFTDTKVTQSETTTSDFRPVVLGKHNTATVSELATTETDQVYTSTKFYAKPSEGILYVTSLQASSTVCANTANSTNTGGIALYGTDPSTYGIMFRSTSNSGKHGYVQSDWATYFTMNEGGTTRGWVFKRQTTGPIASISAAGHAVFNGSVTVGGNSTNTSGCRMEYNSTTQSLDFVFV